MSTEKPKEPTADSQDHPIIFFDGVCHLCNRFVDEVIRHDAKGVFRLASLQGETAAKLLKLDQRQALETVIVLERDRILTKSEAILRVLLELKPFGPAFQLLRIFPRCLRDFVYDIVAAHRREWFGQSDTCRIPTAAEKGRLLP